MIESLVIDLIKGLTTALAGMVLGYIVERARTERKRRLDAEATSSALQGGIVLLLRCELVRLHDTHVVKGRPIDLATRECVQRIYEAYHSLGGNDIGSRLYEELLSQHALE